MRRALVTAVSFLGLVSTADAAPWSPYRDISGDHTSQVAPIVRFGTGVSGLAAWHDGRATYEAICSSPAPEEDACRFGTRVSTAPYDAITTWRAGIAVLHERRGDLVVRGSALSAGLLRAGTLERRTDVRDLAIAGNAHGELIAAWVRERPGIDREVVVAIAGRNGRFTRPARIAPVGERALAIGVDVNEGGDMVVAWTGRRGVRARYRAHGKRFGRIVRLGSSRTFAELHVSVDGTGRAAVAWHSGDSGDGGDPGTADYRIVLRPRRQRWSDPRDLESPHNDAVDRGRLALELADDGRGIVAWEGADGSARVVRAAAISGITVGAPELVRGRGSTLADVAISATDLAVLTGSAASLPSASDPLRAHVGPSLDKLDSESVGGDPAGTGTIAPDGFGTLTVVAVRADGVVALSRRGG